jgi:hypothetical protein
MILGSSIAHEVLERPILDGADEVRAVVGYASPAMAHRHIALLPKATFGIQLTVGMVGVDGLSIGAHLGFKELERSSDGRFSAGYVLSAPPVHSKVFVWLREGIPLVAFTGSANYSQNALLGGQVETMTLVDPGAALAFVDSIKSRAVGCSDNSIPPELFYLGDDSPRIQSPPPSYKPWVRDGANFQEISLLTSRTESGVAYGLNWGQRDGRDPDQSYLPVPSEVAKSHFLPPRGQRFGLITSSGEYLSAVVAQDGDKAIHTPDSNALLGRVIRARLGIRNGAPIVREDLVSARATKYRLYRLDQETYALEFLD